MVPTYEAAVFLTVCAIQLLALASVVSVHLTFGIGEQAWCHRLFYLALLLIGGITMAAVFTGSVHWFTFAGTLALMAVGGTLDLGRRRGAAI